MDTCRKGVLRAILQNDVGPILSLGPTTKHYCFSKHCSHNYMYNRRLRMGICMCELSGCMFVRMCVAVSVPLAV